MTGLGLKDALAVILGKQGGLKYKARVLYWELRYAWQRAWRGYSDEDVFDLCGVFPERMTAILKSFKENNIALLYDEEKKRCLNETETDAVLDEIIAAFESCDEEKLFEDALGYRYDTGDYSIEEMDEIGGRLYENEKNAMRLLSKWIWRLWY